MSSEGLGSVLGLEHLQVVSNDLAGAARLDNVIYVSTFRSLQWVGKCAFVLGCLSLTILTSEYDFDCSLGAHDSNLGRGPRVVIVSVEVLRGHDIVGASVGLPGDEGNLGHCGFGICVEEFRTVLNNTSELLYSAGEESWHVGERDDGNLERVAESHKSRTLYRCIDVKAASENIRLIRDNAHYAPLDITETDYDVLGVLGHDLVEVVAVHDVLNDLLHVVGLVRVEGHDVVQQVPRRLIPAVVLRPDLVRTLHLARLGQVGHQLAGACNRLDVVLEGSVANA